MPKPKAHFLVCTNQRPQGHPKGCCAERGAQEVIGALSGKLQETEAYDKVMVTGTTCLGPCQSGPMVVVYPEGAWYGQMTGQKAKEIFDSHVNEGKPVESYMLPEGTF